MLTENQIQFLNRVCPNSWTINGNVINVKGHVDMNYMELTQIPVQFGEVGGHFDCRYNKLTNLQGSPSIVCDFFNCDYNQLTTLEGGPTKVNWLYSCESNYLPNLIGAPKMHNHNFYCGNNKLTSLEGCPSVIEYDLYCRDNPNLEYLWGIGRVEDEVDYDLHNEINEWIIELAQKDIIFPFCTLEENINWIKREQKYSCLLGAPQKICKYFSPRILNLVDSGVYNESKILDYKKFSSLC